MRLRRGLILMVAALLTACATGGGDGVARRRANLITEAELVESNTLDAYQAIRRLRPNWLTTRAGMEDAVVHIDGIRLNGINDMRDIQVSTLREMAYLTGPDATTRYGTGYRGGLIDLKSKGTRAVDRIGRPPQSDPVRKSRENRTSTRAPASISEIGTSSSAECAFPIEPGPKHTAGIPARFR